MGRRAVEDDEVEIAVVVEIRGQHLPAVAAVETEVGGERGERPIAVVVVELRACRPRGDDV